MKIEAQGTSTEPRLPREITVSRARLFPALFAGLSLVAGAGLAVELLKPIYRLKTHSGVLPLFSLSYEHNIPTWYTSVLLLGCSILLALISIGARDQKETFTNHWRGLAVTFLYISLDEVIQIHEGASGWLSLSGVLYFSWVIPAALVVTVFGLAYLRFLKHLPRPIRDRFLVAGCIYVAGALGMELPLGWWTERAGSNNLVYALVDFVEETMEMIGVNLFLLSLVDYLAMQRWTVGFSTPAAATPAPESQAAAAPEA